MIRIVDIALDERAFLHRNGKPVRYLRPGRHLVLTGWPVLRYELVRVSTHTLLARLEAEQLELVPAEDLKVLRLDPHERAVVRHRGRPVRWLGSGEHQLWTVERTVTRARDGTQVSAPAVEVEVIDTSPVAAEPLREDVKALVPASDYAETTVPHGAVAIRFVDGVLDEVLGPGRHAGWTTQRKVQLAVMDLRERLLHVGGQEVMTKDHVTLRLNLTAQYRIADPRRLATVARDADEVLYLAMQLAAREAVAASTLDQLLASRDELADAMRAEVAARASAVGLEVRTFALKDVILPGDMRTLLNRVMEAKAEAEANVILRREETAATRSLAQTAKVLAEQPLLMRLKELEAYKDLAGKVGQVHVVLGQPALEGLKLELGGS